ncbi:MAG: enoyl-CoA hydratase/isomerase family protein [Haliea sp.]|nr:enoyl-CoA hydratase/isomerase family protein [Haliea sp.]
MPGFIKSIQGLRQTGSGTGWFSAIDELTHESVISIAAISGDSSGGGAELGWACDLRIMEVRRAFSQPEINVRLTTGIGGCSRLARLAGRSVASELVLTGKPQSVQRLFELGAIIRVVAAGPNPTMPRWKWRPIWRKNRRWRLQA